MSHNWFAVVQTSAVAGGLFLASLALFLDARSRRAANLIQLTEQHRHLWERMIRDSQLTRILDPDADLTRKPLTGDEELFVIFVILHLSSTYYAMRAGFFRKPHGLHKDIRLFFSLPIPRVVWDRVRDMQDKPFVELVESCLLEPAAPMEQ